MVCTARWTRGDRDDIPQLPRVSRPPPCLCGGPRPVFNGWVFGNGGREHHDLKLATAADGREGGGDDPASGGRVLKYELENYCPHVNFATVDGHRERGDATVTSGTANGKAVSGRVISGASHRETPISGNHHRGGAVSGNHHREGQYREDLSRYWFPDIAPPRCEFNSHRGRLKARGILHSSVPVSNGHICSLSLFLESTRRFP